MVSNCEPFPIGILGQVWYLIVSIPDLCTLTYLPRVSAVILDLGPRELMNKGLDGRGGGGGLGLVFSIQKNFSLIFILLNFWVIN